MQMMFMMVISVVKLADNVSFDIHVLSHDFCTIIWLHTLFPTRKQKLSLKKTGLSYSTSQKAQKQGEVSLPILSAIPFTNVEFRDGMGLHEHKTSALLTDTATQNLLWGYMFCTSQQESHTSRSMMMQSRSFTKVSGPLVIIVDRHWWTDRKHSRCLHCHAVAPMDKLGVAKLSITWGSLLLRVCN